MTRSRRMQPIQRITQKREDEAAIELGKAQQKLQEQELRLRELQEYRLEYNRNFQTQGRNGISASRFQEFHLFMTSLDQAIEQQQQAVVVAGQLCVQKNRHWQEARMKSKSLEKVVERYQEQEQYEQGRQEQKVLDEMAQQVIRARLQLEKGDSNG